MQARFPRRLDERRHFDFFAHLPHRLGQRDDVRERRVLGVEIDEAPVGLREIGDAAAPDVERNRAEVHEIDERLHVVTDEIVDIALRIFAPDRDRLNPLRDETRCVLLIE